MARPGDRLPYITAPVQAVQVSYWNVSARDVPSVQQKHPCFVDSAPWAY